jgi:hypothetical protein
MTERALNPQPDDRFANPYESRFLQHGNEVKLSGDPETPEDFARAQNYLEAITNHLIEFGPVWEKKPQDIAYELDYHNAWHHYEIEQERKTGEVQATYHEINLKQLQALSKRRVLAFEDTGWEVTHDYRVICHFDQLTDAAVAEQETMYRLIESSQEKRQIEQAIENNPASTHSSE